MARADESRARRQVRAVRKIAGQQAETRDEELPDNRNREAGDRGRESRDEGRSEVHRRNTHREVAGRQDEAQGVVRRRKRDRPVWRVLRYGEEEVGSLTVVWL